MRRIATTALVATFVAACGGAAGFGPDDDGATVPPAANPSGSKDDAGSTAPGQGSTSPVASGSGGSASSGADAGSSPPSNPDAGGTSPPHPSADAGQGQAADASSGPPARNSTCTPLSQQNGTAVDTTHGRMDGTLVYVLPVGGSSSCNGDDAHVHLQIEMGGSIYDVAVDIGQSGDEVGWYEQTLALPGGAWSEGWHGTDALGYQSLGLSSGSFATLSPAAMATQVESLRANTSKISIFCTGYTPGDNGCHDVHYQNGSSEDGALVLDPTAASSPIVFFRFANTSF